MRQLLLVRITAIGTETHVCNVRTYVKSTIHMYCRSVRIIPICITYYIYPSYILLHMQYLCMHLSTYCIYFHIWPIVLCVICFFFIYITYICCPLGYRSVKHAHPFALYLRAQHTFKLIIFARLHVCTSINNIVNCRICTSTESEYIYTLMWQTLTII